MAKLIFLNGVYSGKSFTLQPGKTITIGRNREIDLPLPDLKLSRRHCIISSTEGNFFINDLESTNGTLVNGLRLDGGMQLNPFDRITLGDTEIEFQCPESAAHLEAVAGEAPYTAADRVAAPAIGQKEIAESMAAVANLDPLEAALQEMNLPLPPEPPALGAGSVSEVAASKPKVLFCESCSGSISMLDWDLGVAKEIDKKIFCRDCLAKGVKSESSSPPFIEHTPAAATFSSHETARAIIPAKPQQAPLPQKGKSVDDILAGLDAEPVVIDTAPRKRSAAPIAEPAPAKKDNVDDFDLDNFGSDFEEL